MIVPRRNDTMIPHLKLHHVNILNYPSVNSPLIQDVLLHMLGYFLYLGGFEFRGGDERLMAAFFSQLYIGGAKGDLGFVSGRA